MFERLLVSSVAPPAVHVRRVQGLCDISTASPPHGAAHIQERVRPAYLIPLSISELQRDDGQGSSPYLPAFVVVWEEAETREAPAGEQLSRVRVLWTLQDEEEETTIKLQVQSKETLFLVF